MDLMIGSSCLRCIQHTAIPFPTQSQQPLQAYTMQLPITHLISCFQTIDSQRYPHQCVPETFHYDGKYYSEEGVSIVHNKHRYHTRFHSDILFYFILFYLIFSIYDAFYETGLQDELKGAEVKTVIIAGV